jgi:hypothetical protein
MVIINQFGIVLMSVSTKEAVITLKATSERPTRVGSGGAGLLRWG